MTEERRLSTSYVHGACGGVIRGILVLSGDTLNGPAIGTYLYHRNHINSSSVITDASGSETTRIVYYPFGEISQPNSSGGDNVTSKFTGQEYDEESNLYDYGARYYDAAIGGFLIAGFVIAAALSVATPNPGPLIVWAEATAAAVAATSVARAAGVTNPTVLGLIGAAAGAIAGGAGIMQLLKSAGEMGLREAAEAIGGSKMGALVGALTALADLVMANSESDESSDKNDIDTGKCTLRMTSRAATIP